MSYTAISKKLEKEFAAKPKLRMAVAKMGPCVTDNGNVILDVDFGQIKDPKSLSEKLNAIPGLIEHGLFVNMAERAYFGQEDGSVVTKEKKH